MITIEFFQRLNTVRRNPLTQLTTLTFDAGNSATA